ncbi:hypothetical protein [Hyphomicrobium denitrificans]|uniref:hypothetical protein n=1 Tax=Hyphomicrobium denitrificans TaxID=53399 RepID=UPI001231DAA5|nr:hypothetical protein [Hyphomicrobium denitrificans]
MRLVFQLMRDNGKTYDALEWDSGILRSTIKSWRNEKTPSLQSIEATLGAFGWQLVPVPPLENLPADVRDALDEIGQHFRSDEETLGAALAAINGRAGGPACGGRYRERGAYWRTAA